MWNSVPYMNYLLYFLLREQLFVFFGIDYQTSLYNGYEFKYFQYRNRIMFTVGSVGRHSVGAISRHSVDMSAE